MTLSVLLVGFLIGMQHALEADHLAAVTSMTSQKSGLRAITRHGTFWGLGHALMLIAIAGSAIVLKYTLSADLSALLETAVGVMLVALGAHVLWRLKTNQVHFHVHEHEDVGRHVHAHSHAGEHGPHAESAHHHSHAAGLPWRTFMVGLMHGMAGSAALIVLTAATIQSPMWGFVYVVLFGLGSVVGMAALSLVIALPMTYAARSVTWVHKGLQVCIGLATIAIGAHVMLDSGSALLF